jgi:hypothetical protein
MGALADAIVSFVESVVDVIVDIVTLVWNEVVMPLLEVIVGLFGIEDETIVDIQNVSIKLFEETGQEIVSTALVRTAVGYSNNPSRGALVSLVENTTEGMSKLSGYYDFGLNDYPYALPTTNIRGSFLNRALVKSSIESQLGFSVEVLTSIQRTPSVDVFYKYYLQNSYDYLPYTNTLTYTDAYGTFDYTFGTIDYIVGTDSYNINISRFRPIVKFFLTGPDEVNDGSTTLDYIITSDRVFPAGTSATITIEYSGAAINGTHYNAVTSATIGANSDTAVFSISTILGSASGGDVPLTITVGNIVTQNGFELQEVAGINFSVTTVIKASGAVPDVINNTNAPAPDAVTLPQVINRPSYVANSGVIATYHASTDPSSEWFYWVYDQSTNVYPTLQLETSTITALEMMPIAILRTNSANVTPGSIGTNNYNGVSDLVATLGLTLDDLLDQISDSPDISSVKEAFLLFAVNPTEASEAISRVLFEMYFPLTQTSSSIFNSTTSPSNSLLDSDGNFLATFEEQNVKRALVWTKQEFYTIPHVSGSYGDYTHYITGVRLYLVKQVTPTDCTFIVLHNLSTVEFIEAGGLYNTHATKMGDENFNIPISYYAVNQLSPLEQLELYPYALRINFYAVQVTELSWYETEAFMDFFQIVLIIVTIVITIFTLGTGTAAWIALARQLVVNYLITQIAVAILSSLDNDFAKAVVAAIAIYTMIQLGDPEGLSTLFSDIVQAVTSFSEFVTGELSADYAAIQDDSQKFEQIYGNRLEAIEKEVAANQDSSIDTEYLAYLISPTSSIYAAIQMQYNFDVTYNYDTLVSNYHENALRIGVI